MRAIYERNKLEDFKLKLFQLIEWTYEEEQAFVKNLTAEESKETGKFEKWSARDIIAHNTFWKNKRLEDINIALKGSSPGSTDDYNKINKEVFEENKNKSWEEISSYSDDVYQKLIKTVSAASIDDLTNEKTNPWKMIIIYCCLHPIGHLDRYYVNRNQRFYAINLWKAATWYLKSLPASSGIIGNAKYNLARHYLVSGEDYMGSRLLREALSLNPKLQEKAKKDSVLSSLCPFLSSRNH
jgi:hypothetical protein